MLNKDLASLWESGKFAPSWIIGTRNPESTLVAIKHFSETIMGMPHLPIENNPDFRIIRREPNSSGENLSKHITVDQIRELQKFLSTTNSASKYKIAVIHEAETMNVNASNCCLKILEDTPKNSYIFLITSAPGSMMITIRSRCSIIQASTQNEPIDQSSYLSNLEILGNNKAFIAKLGGKIDKEMLQEFGRSTLHFLSRLIKSQSLTYEEETCINIIKNKSTMQLISKFEKVRNIIEDSKNFDLDPRASFILLIETIAKVF